AEPAYVALLTAGDAAAHDLSLAGQISQSDVVLAIFFFPKLVLAYVPQADFAIVPREGNTQLLKRISRVPCHQPGAGGFGRLLADIVNFLAVGGIPSPDR